MVSVYRLVRNGGVWRLLKLSFRAIRSERWLPVVSLHMQTGGIRPDLGSDPGHAVRLRAPRSVKEVWTIG